MRIGLYGGTFDPVHLGHVHAALAVQEALQLDHVRMVLSARPGHREQPNTANVHRWEMLKLACDEHPTLRADDSEIQRPGVSYAIDTLRQIRANDPQVQLCWIMGMDSYLTLPTWHDWQRLVDFAHLIVVQRPGQQAAMDRELELFQQRFHADSLGTSRAGNIVFLSIPMLDISATQVRCLVQSGSGAKALLADGVRTYIDRNNLYHTSLPYKEGII
jgi:nicotinate-nucleotide adenylyltransferase